MRPRLTFVLLCKHGYDWLFLSKGEKCFLFMHLFIVTRFLRILRDLVVALAHSKDHEIARQSRDPLHYPWSSLTHLCFYDRACAFSSYRECCATVLCRTFARSEKCLFHYNVLFHYECKTMSVSMYTMSVSDYSTMSISLQDNVCLTFNTMSVSDYNVYFTMSVSMSISIQCLFLWRNCKHSYLQGTIIYRGERERESWRWFDATLFMTIVICIDSKTDGFRSKRKIQSSFVFVPPFSLFKKIYILVRLNCQFQGSLVGVTSQYRVHDHPVAAATHHN